MLQNASTAATSFELILDRDQEWRQRLKMIHEATQFLYTATYYIEYDEFGAEYLDALEQALDRGVQILILIDSYGQFLARSLMTKPMRQQLHDRLSRMEESGAHVVYYRPNSVLKRLLGSGYHIKIQTSEQGDVLFASSNISRMSFSKWMEFAVLMNGPVANIMLNEITRFLPTSTAPWSFAYTGYFPVDNEHPYRLSYYAYNPCDDPSQLAPLKNTHPNSLTNILVEAVKAARSSVKITSFYFKPARILQDALVDAAERGVSVEIHHSHMDALETTRITWIAAAAGFPRLIKSGIQIFEHLDGQHTKFLLIDNSIAWLGSYNFEFAADERLAEAMLCTEDSHVCEQIEAFFSRLRQDNRSLPVSEAFPRDLSTGLRLYRLACFPLKRWL